MRQISDFALKIVLAAASTTVRSKMGGEISPKITYFGPTMVLGQIEGYIKCFNVYKTFICFETFPVIIHH